jgi:hypothetical protein
MMQSRYNGQSTTMEQPSLRFRDLAAKTMVCHTISYFTMGVLASHFLHYAEEFDKPGSGMLPVTSPWVMAGPLFQPIRGLIFASVFWPVRTCLFGRKNGWMVMSWMLVAIGILSTFAAASGSVEGMIYTPSPALAQTRGWLEVAPQALLLSALLCYWIGHPGRKWLSRLLGTVFFVMMALPVLGLLSRH